jgi:hypothetical protein
MEEKPGFTVSSVEWRYQASKALGAGLQPRPPIRSGVEAMDVICKSCQHDWKARRVGVGSFLPNVDYVHLKCPECGQEADLPNSELPQRQPS